ncbi:ABC transporter permease [Paenibacillus pinisoli]|uniref:ABC transporter permease n=1 Tax=Paenibacillus pinisoli TaxID=1276110 RepID=A0A3A6PEP0_9BACL|nr:ABC transporter permease [Paenibacillus pinisoli]RJX39367.1 ABC transporter permease [Paenibacillus pinisoli]
MTFRSLALSNVRGNWRSYSAFFLSSVFSVLIFYLYASFLNHPDVVNGHILSAAKVRDGMQFCLYIIMVFSFLFILYSNSAFLKTRKQEFGLFSLFGMTKSQLRKLVIYENIVIAIMAIAVGIGLGILFSKLFFMALAALLGMSDSIAFAVPLKAVWLTAGGFFALFLLISFWTVLRMGRTEIIDLLKASRQPKGKLIFSRWLVIIGALSLAMGYGMALMMDSYNFVILALPILITVVVGTYFLFTQLSIVILKFIQKRHGLYYKRTNMLIFAQLGYKIRDNARILFVVSILSAVIMTALGTVYIMHVQGKQDLVKSSPFSFAYVEKGLYTHNVINPDDLQRIVKEGGFSYDYEAKIVGIGLEKYSITFDGDTSTQLGNGHDETNEYQRNAMIISASDYNKLAKEQGKPQLAVESGKLTLLYRNFDKTQFGSGKAAGYVNGEKIELPVSGSIDTSVTNNWIDANSLTLVMDDLTYINTLSGISEDEQLVFYGYELKNWEKAAPIVEKLVKLVPDDMKYEVDFTRPQRYSELNETVSLTLFIGLFISLLFFIAAGSMIYFKLFTEIQEDQAQFKGLSRIGMTKKEVRRVVVSQIAIIFFIPCIVGISHALFAMRSLDNMMNTSNWIYSFVVIGIYVGMQTIYFLLASNSYMKSMLRGSAA